jgi:hypothetical protein
MPYVCYMRITYTQQYCLYTMQVLNKNLKLSIVYQLPNSDQLYRGLKMNIGIIIDRLK